MRHNLIDDPATLFNDIELSLLRQISIKKDQNTPNHLGSTPAHLVNLGMGNHENSNENPNKRSAGSGRATPNNTTNGMMRDITSILKQRKLENMAWNSSRESGYHTTDNNDTSPSRKSRDRNVIAFDKSVIRDIHQDSRQKNMSNCIKDIESSISHHKKDGMSLVNASGNIFNKENNPPNPYTDTLDYFIDFKTPEKGNSICKNLALESFSKYLEL